MPWSTRGSFSVVSNCELLGSSITNSLSFFTLTPFRFTFLLHFSKITVIIKIVSVFWYWNAEEREKNKSLLATHVAWATSVNRPTKLVPSPSHLSKAPSQLCVVAICSVSHLGQICISRSYWWISEFFLSDCIISSLRWFLSSSSGTKLKGRYYRKTSSYEVTENKTLGVVHLETPLSPRANLSVTFFKIFTNKLYHFLVLTESGCFRTWILSI